MASSDIEKHSTTCYCRKCGCSPEAAEHALWRPEAHEYESPERCKHSAEPAPAPAHVECDHPWHNGKHQTFDAPATGLVERLRERAADTDPEYMTSETESSAQLDREAAAEIERLERQVHLLKDRHSTCGDDIEQLNRERDGFAAERNIAQGNADAAETKADEWMEKWVQEKGRAERAEAERDRLEESAHAMLQNLPVDVGDWPVEDGEAAVQAFKRWVANGMDPEDWGDEPEPDTFVGVILRLREKLVELAAEWREPHPKGEGWTDCYHAAKHEAADAIEAILAGETP